MVDLQIRFGSRNPVQTILADPQRLIGAHHPQLVMLRGRVPHRGSADLNGLIRVAGPNHPPPLHRLMQRAGQPLVRRHFGRVEGVVEEQVPLALGEGSWFGGREPTGGNDPQSQQHEQTTAGKARGHDQPSAKERSTPRSQRWPVRRWYASRCPCGIFHRVGTDATRAFIPGDRKSTRLNSSHSSVSRMPSSA